MLRANNVDQQPERAAVEAHPKLAEHERWKQSVEK
jgi:hypothetical protein